MVRSLNAVSEGCGLKVKSGTINKSKESIFQLFVTPGINARGVTGFSHIERKDQGCTA